MGFLSDRSTTAIVSGGYMEIIIPNGAAPTGYDSFRISVTDLQAALQSQITTNASNISTNASNITLLQDINGRTQYTDETSNFQFSQPANSIVNKIRLRSTGAATCTITGSLSGTIESGINLSDGVLYDLKETIDSVAGQTITFTITGTVSAELYYNTNTI